MGKVSFRFLVIPSVAAMLITGCNGKGEKTTSENPKSQEQTVVPAAAVVIQPGEETTLLLQELVKNGDYVNSQNFPSLIKASVVHENLGKNQLVLDIRDAAAFSKGHIRDAVNKRFEDLPSYFESGIKPFEYERIIIVSDDGQAGSYTSCLLRLMGYGNVFAMRWGMSAWNSRFAETGWLKGVSGKYEDKLETTVNEKPVPLAMPDPGTGFKTGSEIADSRFKKLFSDGLGKILITSDEVFSDPSKYFVVNLERKDKYDAGHIPGAVRFKPESTLGNVEEMSPIPPDKTVVIYCGTGHNSGFATAFLRLLGYDARTLKFGNNGFMHEKMVKERTSLSWLPFTVADVNDFEVAK